MLSGPTDGEGNREAHAEARSARRRTEVQGMPRAPIWGRGSMEAAARKERGDEHGTHGIHGSSGGDPTDVIRTHGWGVGVGEET